MHVQRITAIFEKDIKDFTKNIMLLMMPAIPILLALLYSRMGEGEEAFPIELIYLIVGITFSTVTSSIMMTMMAEENEKNTLRGLIQSPASFIDIIVGKSLVTGLITIISLIISLLIIGIEPLLNSKDIITLILLFLFFLLLGIGTGMFSKSVAATSAYLMPIMLLFGFTPMISLLGLEEGSLIFKILDVFPIVQAIEVHDSNSWMPILIIGIWVVAAAIFTSICFKKTMTDE